MRRSSLQHPDAAERYRDGDRETVLQARDLVRAVLQNHSGELKPYWDDLVSKVHKCVLERVGSTREPIRNLEGFVARVAHTRAMDLARMLKRWRTVSVSEDTGVLELPDPGRGPEGELERREATRRVHALIASADERTRRIWKLIFFEQKKYREAAAELGMPEGSLKRLVHESLRWAAANFPETGRRATGGTATVRGRRS